MRIQSSLVALLLLGAVVVTTSACPSPGTGKKPGGGGEGEEGEGDVGEGEGDVPPDALDPASLLTVDPITSLPADGIAAFTVTAHLKSGAGLPMPGLTVTFATDLGTLGAQPAPTGDDGLASIALASTAVGTATVTATVTTPDGNVALDTPLVVSFEGCRTAAQAFEQELYPKVFSRCQGCHNELGLARLFGVPYQLAFPGVDDWAQRNVQTISDNELFDETTTDGETMPRIAAKPSLRLDEGHEGGLVIVPGSEEDRLLQAFAHRLQSPDSCAGVDDPAEAALARVEVLSPRETYSRAKLALTGAVATPEELAAMPDTDDALDANLDALMTTPAFQARVTDWYADWFLTDRFTKQMGQRRVLNRNSEYTRRFFFAAEGTGNQACNPATDDCCSEFFDATYCATAEDRLIDNLAREPMTIINDIIANDRPISDAITLDHTRLTPYMAKFYGFTDSEIANLGFDADDTNDATEFKNGKIHKTTFNTLGSGGGGVQYPHAGILTTQAMLGRWATTTSNKNRGRAQSIIMRRLLDIDVMKFAEFSTRSLPADADLQSATQTEVACTACHSAVDPLAGLWRHYVTNGPYKVNAPASNTDNMFDSTFLDTPFNAATDGDPIQFVASHVVQHERFPLAMMMPVLTGLTGFEELDNNVNAADPDFAGKALAIGIQHKIMSDLRAKFANEDGLKVKALVKDIVKSEVFRARSISGGSLTDVEKKGLELAGVGRGIMITPEQLDRKIASIFGFSYRLNRSPTGSKLLLDVNQYRILFGGINYEAISKRFRDPSPVLTRIIERMGNEVSCIGVPQDFSISNKADRALFTLAEATDEDDATVRAQVKRLHALILDENLADNDPELQATVDVFNDALSQGRAAIASGDADDQLRTDCRATKTYDAAQTPYPTGGHVVVSNDPDYNIRAWMAVVSYLLNDARFFTE